MRITNVWNSLGLPFSVITAPSVNSFKNRLDKHWASQELRYDRALKSREIFSENTGIFAHMWHQRSLLGVNQSRPLTLNDHWRSTAIKVA